MGNRVAQSFEVPGDPLGGYEMDESGRPTKKLTRFHPCAGPALPGDKTQTDADHLVGFVVAITKDLARLQLEEAISIAPAISSGVHPTRHSRRQRTSSSWQMNKENSPSLWAGHRAVQPPLDFSTRSKRPSSSVFSIMR